MSLHPEYPQAWQRRPRLLVNPNPAFDETVRRVARKLDSLATHELHVLLSCPLGKPGIPSTHSPKIGALRAMGWAQGIGRSVGRCVVEAVEEAAARARRNWIVGDALREWPFPAASDRCLTARKTALRRLGAPWNASTWRAIEPLRGLLEGKRKTACTFDTHDAFRIGATAIDMRHHRHSGKMAVGSETDMLLTIWLGSSVLPSAYRSTKPIGGEWRSDVAKRVRTSPNLRKWLESQPPRENLEFSLGLDTVTRRPKA